MKVKTKVKAGWCNRECKHSCRERYLQCGSNPKCNPRYAQCIARCGC